MDDGQHSPPSQAEASGVSDDTALLSNRQRPGLTITVPEESRPQSRGRHSRNSSIADDETISIEPHQGRRSDHMLRPPPEPPSPGRLAPAASAVSSLLRRLTTVRSPISRTKFRTIRRQGGQYATLSEGTDGEYYPVDLSSLAGLGYELRDMSGPGPESETKHLQDEATEYVRPQTEQQAPDFQTFVNKRKSIGDGLKDVGAEIKRNPTKVPRRGQSSKDGSSAVSRSKTVRDIGQNLAREKNQIVVLNDAVDLSSLEGSHPLSYRASQTFDGFGVDRAGTMPQETQSYFFPDDPDVPNWKPFSMKAWYIGILTALAFGLAGLQEALFQVSSKKHTDGGGGGLLSFDSVADVSVPAFFAWKYLPTMVTIIYAVMFSIMDFDIRRLEPFYQLSQPSGATAAASLNLDHLTMFQYFIPFKAFSLGQWAVFASSVANIVASMAAPALQNPSLQFGTNQLCEDQDLTIQAGRCEKLGQRQYYVYVPSVWSRLVTSSYLIIGLILLVLMYQLRRKSGLLSDPNGIAGIASMATRSHILRDFKGLDEANHNRIHKRLAHRRFVLYKSSIWQGEWNAEEEHHHGDDKVHSPHPMMLRKRTSIPFIGFMVFGLITIPLIGLTKARAVPNAAPWLPVLLATMLKLLFTTFESDVRLMEPFYLLSKGNALPQNSLTLDYQATVYGWMPFKAAMNGHYLVALVGVASVVLDILTVTVGSFSVDSMTFLHRHSTLNNGQEISNQDETFRSFWISLVLSVTILLFVIVTTALVYWRRSHPFLPREPSTIASVMAFIYASNMLTDFIDTERLTTVQMEHKLKALGKRYGLGWFRGRDGEVHCAIDEEPMTSRYVHGKSLLAAQAGPLDLRRDETFYGA